MKKDVKSIFNKDSEKKPQLIDEWHLVPAIWDAVRRECDITTEKGNFIITGSTTLPNKIMKEKVHHSGAGRIGRLNMYTMSLYESGDSTGKASLTNMLNHTDEAKKSLLNFYDNMIKKPAFMCIVVGKCSAVVKDPETGIYIVPITALKP